MTKPGTEQRRICWPSFDLTCLEGGCGYCNGHRFRNVESIRKAVERGQASNWNRCTPAAPDDSPMRSFDYGRRRAWGNADSRVTG